jgi:hypothetical protein
VYEFRMYEVQVWVWGKSQAPESKHVRFKEHKVQISASAQRFRVHESDVFKFWVWCVWIDCNFQSWKIFSFCSNSFHLF